MNSGHWLDEQYEIIKIIWSSKKNKLHDEVTSITHVSPFNSQLSYCPRLIGMFCRSVKGIETGAKQDQTYGFYSI